MGAMHKVFGTKENVHYIVIYYFAQPFVYKGLGLFVRPAKPTHGLKTSAWCVFAGCGDILKMV